MHILKVTKEDELGLQRKLYSIFSFVLLACTFQYRNEIAIPLFWQYINIYIRIYRTTFQYHINIALCLWYKMSCIYNLFWYKIPILWNLVTWQVFPAFHERLGHVIRKNKKMYKVFREVLLITSLQVLLFSALNITRCSYLFQNGVYCIWLLFAW